MAKRRHFLESGQKDVLGAPADRDGLRPAAAVLVSEADASAFGELRVSGGEEHDPQDVAQPHTLHSILLRMRLRFPALLITLVSGQMDIRLSDVASWKRAVELNPGELGALYNLAMSLANSAPREALPHLERFAKEAPPACCRATSLSRPDPRDQ